MAAIIKDKDLLLIAKRHSTDSLSGKWEFPGGKLEPGETPEGCLVREINPNSFSITSFLLYRFEIIFHISIYLFFLYILDSLFRYCKYSLICIWYKGTLILSN
ncbi:NUDIX domain-containing protein [Priestia megaterium]|uniref:NUDIX domain-containing protein n=1 Tax=Priestia megaterium TaxID=1404 RepID=UPI003D950E71